MPPLVRQPGGTCGRAWRARAAGLIALAAALLLSEGLRAAPELLIQNGSCRVTFDPATLALSLQSGRHPPLLVSAAHTNLGKVGGLEWQPTRARCFEPDSRLPLFQTVFHDSVIATHHWSFASLKPRDEARTVELLELLYQVPPLYHLNAQQCRKRRAQIKRHYDFFSPLHRETALLPLTDFQWLTADGAVQRTVFGGRIELVANFGTTDFKHGDATVGRGGILVQRRDTGTKQEYVP